MFSPEIAIGAQLLRLKLFLFFLTEKETGGGGTVNNDIVGERETLLSRENYVPF